MIYKVARGSLKAMIIGLAVTFTTAVYLIFRRQLDEATSHLLAGGKVIETAYGPIEYKSQGNGPVVLVIHGIWGGYDHGALVTLIAENLPVQVISISRPGYLRTPLSVGSTPAAEVDAYAALLDGLGIKQVAVVGMSAGGPAALQFTLRHPQRCWGLIMLSAVSHGFVPLLSRTELLLARLLNIDFVMWIVRRFFAGVVMAAGGVTPEVQARIVQDPQKVEIIRALLMPFPVGRRRAGFYRDLEYFPKIPSIPLREIQVPTLVIHGTSDVAVPFQHGQFVAELVPNAEIIAIKDGSHFAAVTHKEQILSGVTDFLLRNAPLQDGSQGI